MRIYWNAEVQVDKQCKVMMGGSTASDVIAKCMTDAIYYQAIYPGASVVIANIESACHACHGVGTTSKALAHGKRKDVKCPNCKGKHVPVKMDNIPLTMPNSANRIRLVQDVA